VSQNIFLISDTHFSQESFLTFKEPDGSPARPFASVEEADETMVERWNAVVKPGDKVYHLGDVAFKPRHLEIMLRLNGAKRLIMGNHDTLDTKHYLKYFKTLYSVRPLEGIIMSHIPIHRDCLGRFGSNVHGHLHHKVIHDPRYLNVCVEKTDYAPIEFSEVLSRLVTQ
jgi:calcineurin-like phosphoesterase family protein